VAVIFGRNSPIELLDTAKLAFFDVAIRWISHSTAPQMAGSVL
jgi:hypothetical protein